MLSATQKTADEIRSMEMWVQHFQETMLREIAAQLAEIKALLKDGMAKLNAGGKAKAVAQPYVPHPDDKRHGKGKR